MQSPPSDLTPDDLLDAVRRAWLPDAVSAEYLPVGFGSHHWRVEDASGRPWFVSADDVRDDPGAARLSSAFGVAAAARAAGVVGAHGPLSGRDGALVVPVGRWGVSVQPWLDGTAGRFGDRWEDEAAVALVRLLAGLHAVEAPGARPEETALPGRPGLEEVLADVAGGGRPTGGPLAGEVAALLARSLPALRAALDASDVDRPPDPAKRVVTHGEPHPGNVVRTASGLVLVDWDTARLAEPERDLWLVSERTSVDVAGLYEELTGRTVDRSRLSARARHWALLDVASFVPDLLAAGSPDEDTEWQLAALSETLGGL